MKYYGLRRKLFKEKLIYTYAKQRAQILCKIPGKQKESYCGQSCKKGEQKPLGAYLLMQCSKRHEDHDFEGSAVSLQDYGASVVVGSAKAPGGEVEFSAEERLSFQRGECKAFFKAAPCGGKKLLLPGGGLPVKEQGGLIIQNLNGIGSLILKAHKLLPG